MDPYTNLEKICKSKKLHPIKVIGLKGKDIGIVRKDNNKDDFKIIAYDLESNKKIGSADFFMEDTAFIKGLYHLNNDDSKAYSSNFYIKEKYRSIGLSKILLEESISILDNKGKLHIALFATPKGTERVKHQLLQLGYKEAKANKKDYPSVVYKKH